METEQCEILVAYQLCIYYSNHINMNEAEKLALFAEYQTRKCANPQFTLSDLSGWARKVQSRQYTSPFYYTTSSTK